MPLLCKTRDVNWRRETPAATDCSPLNPYPKPSEKPMYGALQSGARGGQVHRNRKVLK